ADLARGRGMLPVGLPAARIAGHVHPTSSAAGRDSQPQTRDRAATGVPMQDINRPAVLGRWERQRLDVFVGQSACCHGALVDAAAGCGSATLGNIMATGLVWQATLHNGA